MGRTELVDAELKRIINVIYDYRSMFVHRARSPPFDEGNASFVVDVYDNRPIMIFFSLSELEEMLENSMKRHFDEFQSGNTTSR